MNDSEFSVLRMRFIPVLRKAWEYLAWDVRADVAAIADKLCLFGHVCLSYKVLSVVRADVAAIADKLCLFGHVVTMPLYKVLLCSSSRCGNSHLSSQ